MQNNFACSSDDVNIITTTGKFILINIGMSYYQAQEYLTDKLWDKQCGC